MANTLQRFLYNITIGLPTAVVFSIVWYIQGKSNKLPLIVIITIVLLIIWFYFFFKYAKRNIAPIEIRIESIECIDGNVITYILAYCLPFGDLILGDTTVLVFSVIAGLIVLILPFTKTSYPNPLLLICGYNFYSVNTATGVNNYLLLSKRPMRDKKDVKAVKRIFEYFLLDVEGG